MNLMILLINGSVGCNITTGFDEIWVVCCVEVLWTLVELYVLTSVTTLVYLSTFSTIVIELDEAESATIVDW